MSTTTSKKKKSRGPRRRSPGRPVCGPLLTRERLLGEARRQLERAGMRGFSMRGLATGLGVDPMAPYHYFPDRESLLRAAALDYYESFHVEFGRVRSWRRKLEMLADAYLEFVADSMELLVFLTGDDAGAAAAAAKIAPYFEEATRSLELVPALRRDFLYIYFDFLHGHALGNEIAPRGPLRILLAGVASLAGT